MVGKRTRYLATAAVVATGLYVSAIPGSFAQSNSFPLFNPDWFIDMTDSGYADVAADVEGGRNTPLYFREYLSGEWGAAIGFLGGPVEWLEPNFVFPDWTTNSTFAVTSPIAARDLDANGAPDFNADGFNIYSSTIANPRFSINQTFEFINTGIGIAQGTNPRSFPDPGSFATGSQYVLKQTYNITNRTAEPIHGVQLYQFVHGLHSRAAVVDDNYYGEPSFCAGIPCADYRFDSTLWGNVRAFVDLDSAFFDFNRMVDVSSLFAFAPGIDDAFFASLLGRDEAAIEAAFLAFGVGLDPFTLAGIARADIYVQNVDAVSFHSRVPPIGWEVGRYGVVDVEDHVFGKPSTGPHLSVEANTLNGLDVFNPGTEWVSGAQSFPLGDLAPGATVSFDVLLSVSTTQTIVQKQTAPPPSAPPDYDYEYLRSGLRLFRPPASRR